MVSRSMKTLGFDPSLTNFGWAIHDTSAKGLARCPKGGLFQTSSKTLFIHRYKDIRDRVSALIERLGVRYVGCEYPVFGNLWSEGMYGLFLYTCEAMEASGVDVVFFSPGQIKEHARRSLERPKINGKKWKMEKSDMSDAARHDVGLRGPQWNHNKADAYLCARAAGRFWLFVEGVLTLEDLDDIERRQFTKTHTYQRGKRAGKTVKSGIQYREDERFFRWYKPTPTDI